MRWFQRRRPEPRATEAATAAAETHRSLALAELLGELHPDRRLHILDLGPAVGANISFWSDRHRCSVQVADFYRSLPLPPGADPEEAVRDALPGAHGSVDLVLAWDLLNYLDRDLLGTLAGRLGKLCHRGSVLFAMMSTVPEIPREPGSYLIHPDGTLTYRVDRTRPRPGPRYRPADLAKLMPGFATDRNFLLRHGVQEYLLVRTEDL
ncbi:MAG TPA: hypothetical protein VHQ65_01035 [Thermoanaerobaculia bacterium]|nr:hypothetical protein [Thermoanaerobaculia bacterium]